MRRWRELGVGSWPGGRHFQWLSGNKFQFAGCSQPAQLQLQPTSNPPIQVPRLHIHSRFEIRDPRLASRLATRLATMQCGGKMIKIRLHSGVKLTYIAAIYLPLFIFYFAILFCTLRSHNWVPGLEVARSISIWHNKYYANKIFIKNR